MNDAILHSLRQHIDAEKAIVLPRFFKTGEGQSAFAPHEQAA